MGYLLTVPRRKQEELVLVFALVVIISSIVGVVVFHGALQRTYGDVTSYVSKFVPSALFTMNTEWTNNLGVDSNYVNCTGTVWNPSIKEARNVSLIVYLEGPNHTPIKSERIPIGNIGALQEKAYYVNVYYSGELTDVSVGVTWN
jgi:hypothetical protein